MPARVAGNRFPKEKTEFRSMLVAVEGLYKRLVFYADAVRERGAGECQNQKQRRNAADDVRRA